MISLADAANEELERKSAAIAEKREFFASPWPALAMRSSRPTRKLGFGGMRERVRQLGGTLKVQSQATGTTVSAILKIG